MSNRRDFLANAAVGLALAVPGLATRALAQTDKPLRIIVGFPAGGGVDLLARAFAEKLRGRYASTVLVENRVGASGRVSVDFVKAAPADGSVVLLTTDSPLVVYPNFHKTTNFAPLQDLAPIADVATAEVVLSAGPALPESIRTLKDFAAWAKAHPKQASIATTPIGSTGNFIGLLLKRAIGADLAVAAYKGGALAIQDLLASQVSISVNPIGEVLPFVNSGKLRALATTGTARSRFLADVATMQEQGFTDTVPTPRLGFLAPARAPSEIIERLNTAVGEAIKTRELKEAFSKYAFESAFSTPAQMAATLGANQDRWANIIKATGVKLDE